MNLAATNSKPIRFAFPVILFVLLSCSGDRGSPSPELLGRSKSTLRNAQWDTLSVGASHTCGVLEGELYCWGQGDSGVLGNGSEDDETTPRRVGAASDWDALAAGANHTCGIRDEELYCWGLNESGQVGTGAAPSLPVPVQVGSADDWNFVAAGLDHTCAIRGSGDLYCWGADSDGQLGLGSVGSVIVPVRVGTESTWTSVAAGSGTTCGIRSGSLWCWGKNAAGELGLGHTTSPQQSPVLVGSATNWSAIATGMELSCGIRAGELYCAGSGIGSVFTQVGTLSDWQSIAVGHAFACGIQAGALYCWGSNERGQLGLGDTTSRSAPALVDAGMTWSDISTSLSEDPFACALKGGLRYCWGANDFGNYGDGSTTSRLTPWSIANCESSSSTDTTCDGVDDNCNDATDEGYSPQSTSCGVGACASTGATSCVVGEVSDDCVPDEPLADDYACEGIDEDCDGTVDEDCTCDDEVATATAHAAATPARAFICNAVPATFHSDGFESGTLSSWTPTGNTQANSDTAYVRTGSYSLEFRGPGSSTLQRTFSTAGISTAYLKFYVRTRGPLTGSDTIRVRYSLDGGTSWTTMLNAAGQLNSWGLGSPSVPISSQLLLSFEATLTDNTRYVYFDDISITGTCTTATWFAIGSNESLGTNGSASSTLYELDSQAGVWRTGACPICGNGTVENGEACDDGDRTTTYCGADTCQVCGPHCQNVTGGYCGDSTVQEQEEECDDGNAVENDSCRSDCTRTPLAIFGESVIEWWDSRVGHTLVGGEVDAWVGQHQGITVEPSTTAQRPGYGVDGTFFNGESVVQFSGDNQLLHATVATPFAAAGTRPYFAFVGRKRSDTSAAQDPGQLIEFKHLVVDEMDPAPDVAALRISTQSVPGEGPAGHWGVYYRRIGQTPQDYSVLPHDTEAHLFEYVLNATTGASLYIDGVLIARDYNTAHNVHQPLYADLDSVNFSAWLSAGGTIFPQETDLSLAEVILLDAEPTAAQRAALLEHAQSQWGTSCATEDCTVVECGDGVVSGDEECDPGAPGSPLICDYDCTFTVCGDARINTAAGETCDSTRGHSAYHCPADCDDGVACTSDVTTGSATNCNIVCSHLPVTACTHGDGCCPAGCNNNNDDDCEIECGNAAAEQGEQCDDGNAVDNDECRNDCTLTPLGVFGESMVEWWDSRLGYTLANGDVSAWEGQALGITLTAPSESRPTRAADGTHFNSVPVVQFSGDHDYLERHEPMPFVASGTRPYFAFVARMRSLPGGAGAGLVTFRHYTEGPQEDSGMNVSSIAVPGGTGWYAHERYSGQTPQGASAPIADTGTHLFEYVLEGDTGVSLYVDGVLAARGNEQGSNAGSPLYAAIDDITLRSARWAPNNTMIPQFVELSLAQLVLLEEAPSAAQRLQFRAIAHEQWGTPLCGDASSEGAEQCDDGNSDDTDACHNDCTVPSPEEIFGEVIEWWDSRLGTTLANGDVAAWRGQERGITITAPAGNRPSHAADGSHFNGESVVQFSGSQEYLYGRETTPFVASGTRPYLAFVGRLRGDIVPAMLMHFRHYTTGSAEDSRIALAAYPEYWQVTLRHAGSTPGDRTPFAPDTEPHLFEITIGEHTGLSLYIDGELVSRDNNHPLVALPMYAPLDEIQLVAAAFAPGNELLPQIAEFSLAQMILLESEPTRAQRSALLEYARRNWDVSCTIVGDECSSNTCGDGVVSGDEQCDPEDEGWTATCDSDCTPPTCGDGRRNAEAGETCDTEPYYAHLNCPATCDDSIACTADVMQGSPSTCDVVCSNTPITACADGDGCCVSGCNNANDDDCAPVCGNDVVESGETCDEGDQETEYCGLTSCEVCDATCQLVEGGFCSDGTLDLAYEECDDENQDPDDGCNSDCTVQSCDLEASTIAEHAAAGRAYEVDDCAGLFNEDFDASFGQWTTVTGGASVNQSRAYLGGGSFEIRTRIDLSHHYWTNLSYLRSSSGGSFETFTARYSLDDGDTWTTLESLSGTHAWGYRTFQLPLAQEVLLSFRSEPGEEPTAILDRVRVSRGAAVPYEDDFDHGEMRWAVLGYPIGTAILSEDAAYSGAAGLRIEGDADVRLSIDTTSLEEPELHLRSRRSLPDPDDRFTARYSLNGGSTWQTIFQQAGSSSTWTPGSLPLPVAANVLISFDLEGAANSYVDLDDVGLGATVVPASALLTDDFESTQLDWQVVSGSVTSSTERSHGGSRSAHLPNASEMRTTIDTSAVPGAQLSYWRAVEPGANSLFAARYSVDGGDHWTVVDSSPDESSWEQRTIPLPRAQALLLSFVTLGFGESFVDDVLVEPADRTFVAAQDFEGALVSPWQSTGTFEIREQSAHSGGSGAFFSDEIEATIDTSGSPTSTLSYWRLNDTGSSDELIVSYSLNAGSTWTTLESTSGTYGWTQRQFSLPSASALLLSFQVESPSSGSIELDEVLITGGGASCPAWLAEGSDIPLGIDPDALVSLGEAPYGYGVWRPLSSSDATCNGADDDCDGQRDEDCVEVDRGEVCDPNEPNGLCRGGLECRAGVGDRFGYAATTPVCWDPSCDDWDWAGFECGTNNEYCGLCPTCPTGSCASKNCGSDGCWGSCGDICDAGEAGCENDGDCGANLSCLIGAGPRFGLATNLNVCVPSDCQSLVASRNPCLDPDNQGEMTECGVCPELEADDCERRICGPDFAGGTCGTTPEGFGCVDGTLLLDTFIQLPIPIPNRPIPDLATTEVGALPGDFAVSLSGDATYRMPLRLPPGRGGMTPGLALSYSSSRGNGFIGVGWALDGMQAISRCARTIAQDGRIEPAQLDDNDAYCLNGQRLVEIGEREVGEETLTEYALETNDFSSIVEFTATSGMNLNGPERFELTRPDGQVLTFGGTKDSRVLGRAFNGRRVQTWALSRTTDPYGNYAEILYAQPRREDQDVALHREYYPTSIRYSMHPDDPTPQAVVAFEYSDERPDPIDTWRNRTNIQINRRLSRIKVLNSGQARHYVLSYESGEPGEQSQSRLTSVQECVGSGLFLIPTTCIPPTTFAYESGGGLEAPVDIADASDQKLQMVFDFDGDGRDDLLVLDSGTNPPVDTVLLTREDPETGEISFDPIANIPGGPHNRVNGQNALLSALGPSDFHVLDWNNDGRDDILDIVSGTVFRSEGNRFERDPIFLDLGPQTVLVDWETDLPDEHFVLDLDGDGRADLLTCDDADGSWRYALRDATGFAQWSAKLIGPKDSCPAYIPQLPTDYTEKDLIAWAVHTRNAHLGQSIPPRLTPVPTRIHFSQVIDVDGDGTQELLVIFNDLLGSRSSGKQITRVPGYLTVPPPGTEWEVVKLKLPTNGSSAWMDSFETKVPFSAKQIDLNGDGLRDFYAIAFCTSYEVASDVDSEICQAGGPVLVRSWINGGSMLNGGVRFRENATSALSSDDAWYAWNYTPNSGDARVFVSNLEGAEQLTRVFDYDGDGHQDVLMPAPPALSPTLESGWTGWIVLRSTGSGFEKQYLPYSLPWDEHFSVWDAFGESEGIDPNTAYPLGELIRQHWARSTPTVLDMNGDGIGDILKRHSTYNSEGTLVNEQWQILLREGPFVPRLTRSTDGLGKRVEISYAELTNLEDSALSGGSADNCGYPLRCAALRHSAVDAHEVGTIDPIGGGTVAKLRYSYNYIDGRVDAWGRGFVGFARWEMEERPAFSSSDYTRLVYSEFDNHTRDDDTNLYYRAMSPIRTVDQRDQDGVTYGTEVTREIEAVELDQMDHTLHSFERKRIEIRWEQRGGAPVVELSKLTTRVEETDEYGNPRVIFRGVVGPGGIGTGEEFRTDVPEGLLVISLDYLYEDETHGNFFRAPFLRHLVMRKSEFFAKTDSARPWSTDVLNVRYTDYGYEDNGALTSVVVEPEVSGEPQPNRESLYKRLVIDRDDFGNIIGQQEFDLDASSPIRGQEFVYETSGAGRGLFPTQVVNAKGHVSTLTFDPRYGEIVRAIDPNGAKQDTYFDNFGRVIGTVDADGSMTTVEYRAGNAERPLQVETQVQGGLHEAEDFDAFGRSVHTDTQGIGGESLVSDSTYDFLDRVTSQTTPHRAGEVTEALVSKTFTYDERGRPLSEGWRQPDIVGDRPVGNTYCYEGRYECMRNPRGFTSCAERDSLGRVVATWDSPAWPDAHDPEFSPPSCTAIMGGLGSRQPSTSYGYGEFLEKVVNATGGLTRIELDRYGRRLRVEDPDAGESLSEWNAHGEVVSIRDANANITDMEYDALGRLVKRTDKDLYGTGQDGVTQWFFDGADPDNPSLESGEYIGALTLSRSHDGQQNRYRYDDIGQLTEIEQSVVGSSEDPLVTEFDDYEFGRATLVRYPSAGALGEFAVRKSFDAFGNLITVQRDGATGAPLWQLEETNFYDQIKEEHLGNGNVIEYTHDTLGRLRTTIGHLEETLFVDDPFVRELSYDDNGNVVTRVQGLQVEDLRYDHLDRLRFSTVSSTPTEIEYDVLGNITSRDGVGDYEYESPNDPPTGIPLNSIKPHAVSQAGSTAYSYDAAGQMTVRNPSVDATEYFRWTRFGKIAQMWRGNSDPEQGQDIVMMRYDADEQRVAKETTGSTTTYMAGLYERRDHSDGRVEHVYYVDNGSRVIAQFSVESDGTSSSSALFYVHSDHLGSPEVLTGENGAAEELRSYGPFGARRNPLDWLLPDSNSSSPVSMSFTSHEDDEYGLTNMIGRQYDSRIGRFVSADPFVQAPSFSQSLNRYSYVANNPITLVDPTGYGWSCRTVRSAASGEGELQVCKYEYDAIELQEWFRRSGLDVNAAARLFDFVAGNIAGYTPGGTAIVSDAPFGNQGDFDRGVIVGGIAAIKTGSDIALGGALITVGSGGLLFEVGVPAIAVGSVLATGGGLNVANAMMMSKGGGGKTDGAKPAAQGKGFTGGTSKTVTNVKIGKQKVRVDVEYPTGKSTGNVHIQTKGEGKKTKYYLNSAKELDYLPKSIRSNTDIQSAVNRAFEQLQKARSSL